VAFKIKITNSEIGKNAKVLNDLKSGGMQDVDMEIDKVKIDEAAKVMDGWSDVQVSDAVYMLQEYMDKLDKNSAEYRVIHRALGEIETSPNTVKDILKKYIPQITVTTLSNVLGKLLVRHV